MIAIAWLLTTGAHAQGTGDFTELQGPLFTAADLNWDPADASPAPTSIGSPAVVRRSAQLFAQSVDILVMVYETQVGPATAGCPVGEWGLGWAFSLDGVNWNDQGALLLPGDAFYTCVAAHPSIVALPALANPDIMQWVVYFKAEQDPSTCDPADGWGCDRYPGLGRFVFESNVRASFFPPVFTFAFTASPVDPAPVLGSVAQDMGYPSVVFAGGQYRMMYAQNPDLFVTSGALGNSFPAPTTPAVTAGSSALGWDDSELFSPSLVCSSSPLYKAFVGGRVFMPYPTILDQSLGLYESATFGSFVEGSGPFRSAATGTPQMRHIDAHGAGGGAEFGAYFSSPGTSGNEIWLTSTAGFDPQDIDSKRCP